jgi:DNA-binding cell septation regulator SpoVG
MSDITVIAIRRLSGDKPLKAFVDVKVGAWSICDFRIVKQAGQRAWVSPPQASWKTDTGEVRYRSILTIPSELKQRIDVAVLSAWEQEAPDAASEH